MCMVGSVQELSGLSYENTVCPLIAEWQPGNLSPVSPSLHFSVMGTDKTLDVPSNISGNESLKHDPAEPTTLHPGPHPHTYTETKAAHKPASILPYKWWEEGVME